MPQPDALQANRREDVACSVGRERRKAGAGFLQKLLGKMLPRYACSHQPTIRPSARNNLVADGSRSRLSRWLTSRWVGSRFQRSLHGHAVQGNIWSMSKVFRLSGRSVQAQCRLPASTTLSATCRARDTSRAGSDQRIAANIFVSARGAVLSPRILADQSHPFGNLQISEFPTGDFGSNRQAVSVETDRPFRSKAAPARSRRGQSPVRPACPHARGCRWLYGNYFIALGREPSRVTS